MADKMNMVIKNVAGDDIYGEAFAVEVQLEQQDGTELYVMCNSAAGDYILSVSSSTQLPVFKDAKKEDVPMLERYEFMIGETETYADVMESAYYKAFDLAAYILTNVDWTAFDKSVEELGRPYLGKNIDEIGDTETLAELLETDEED